MSRPSLVFSEIAPHLDEVLRRKRQQPTVFDRVLDPGLVSEQRGCFGPCQTQAPSWCYRGMVMRSISIGPPPSSHHGDDTAVLRVRLRLAGLATIFRRNLQGHVQLSFPQLSGAPPAAGSTPPLRTRGRTR